MSATYVTAKVLHSELTSEHMSSNSPFRCATFLHTHLAYVCLWDTEWPTELSCQMAEHVAP